MLIITKEFKKGILFVRLKGDLVKSEIAYLNKEVTKVVADLKICNVVFNISDLSGIDMEGISALLYNYNLCKENHGFSVLCGVSKNIGRIVDHSSISDIYQAKDEVSVMNMVRG